MRILLHDISKLYRVADKGENQKAGNEMQEICMLENAWLKVENGKIHSLGTGNFPNDWPDAERVNCKGRIVFPGFCDSHTHLIFATSREEEFVDKIRGLSYEEIAKRGGGILNSARKLQQTSDEELYVSAMKRADEILRTGTTTVEIKSGYGLTVKDELRMLRIAKRIGEDSQLTVRTTLLGAHALPPEFKDKREVYIRKILDEMIPAAAEEKLADFVDVFCDKGFFTVDETEKILDRGRQYGLRGKIHANELDFSGGVQVGVRMDALSVDHLECADENEFEALRNSGTIPTLLPSTAFFLGLHYPRARKMIEMDLPVCLASDFNPGSSPSGSMPFVLSLACIRMKMLPEEALTASTLNGAAALDLSKKKGTLEAGKDADIVITSMMDNLAQLPYFFTRNPVSKVICGGKLFDFAHAE